MKALFWLTIVMALAATAGLAVVALRDRTAEAVVPAHEPDREEPGPRSEEPRPRPEPTTLRRYQTTATLTEDLRDALAGEPKDLFQEWRRVSGALETKARWTLENVASLEASPRVRALLVLAAGVHMPDEDLLLAFLEDRRAIVRHAAALATGYQPTGTHERELIEGLAIPLGRRPASVAQQRLRRRGAAEQDAEVRKAIEAVLSGASRRR